MIHFIFNKLRNNMAEEETKCETCGNTSCACVEETAKETAKETAEETVAEPATE